MTVPSPHPSVSTTLADLRGRPALERALERRSDQALSLLLVDIDRFRVVNDVLGRRRADDLLLHLHGHLAAHAGPDAVFWLGGDAFAVLGPDGRARAEVLVASIAQLTDAGLPLIVSVGGVDLTGEPPDELMRRADIALRDAKERGGGRVEWFDRVRHRDALLQQQLRPEIIRAVRDNELQMHYQPIVRLIDGALAGFEALLRWFHPQRGPLSPGLFMPAAERDGLIGMLGEWVINEVTRQMRDFAAHGADPLVTINLSRLQLLDPHFASHTLERLARAGLDPASVGFELTESTVIDDNPEVRSQVAQLRSGGTLLLIDDFGMGASSLASLHHLPVDLLKIDRAFVRGAVTSERQAAIARSIVEIGHALGLSVIAEGIETAEELAAVTRFGCDYGQGFLLGRPAPFSAALAALHDRRPRE